MMFKRKKLVAFVVALAAALALTAAAFARQEGHHGGPGGPPPGGPGGPHGPHGGSLVEHLSRALNLTDAQKAQVKQIEDSLRESTKPLQEQLFKMGGPLDGFKDGFDEAAVRAAAQQRAAIQVELEVAHARAMSQVYALLTADQKAKLAEIRQQMEQHRPGPPPEGAGAPPPPPGEGEQ